MYRFSKYREHYSAILKLALPIVISQLGHIFVQFADNVMVGQYGGDDPLPLAAVSFGVSMSFLFFITGQGITLGLTPLIGELFAQGDVRRSASYLKHAILLYSLLGILFVILQIGAEPLLYRMGQPVEVVDAALPYYRMMAYSILPVMLFSAFKNFLDGVGNTTVPMIIMMFCNLLNIVLNWVFIYGMLGAEEMGVEGAGLATLLSRILMPILGIGYFALRSRYRAYTSLIPSTSLGKSEVLSLLKMGTPIAAQMLLESAAFVITGVMMGWFDAIAISANQIAMTLGNAAFMIVVAVGTAVTIRVSHCYGARDVDSMSLTAKASLHLVLLWDSFAALIFVIFNHQIPQLFTSNAEVIQLASQMLIMVALYQIFDAIQCAGIGILRGIQDVKIIPWISFLAYIVLNIPVGYLCGFTLGLGPCGLFLGYLFGLGTSAILFLFRIRRKIHGFRVSF
ncbi:MAG: MATE family efflux transporter [Rikenellaceae bacterium]|nr:MATE family efflux transporter [Rikenellaceae bacterium]